MNLPLVVTGLQWGTRQLVMYADHLSGALTEFLRIMCFSIAGWTTTMPTMAWSTAQTATLRFRCVLVPPKFQALSWDVIAGRLVVQASNSLVLEPLSCFQIG